MRGLRKVPHTGGYCDFDHFADTANNVPALCQHFVIVYEMESSCKRISKKSLS